MNRSTAAVLVLVAVLAAVAPAGTAAQADPGASRAADVVVAYLGALHANDMRAAYARLTPSQRAYFISVANFASNFDSTGFSLERYAVTKTMNRGTGAYEVDVHETFVVREIGSGSRLRVTTDEPYFVIDEAGSVGVKQLGQPWRAYALDARGQAHGLNVRVARVEFFDHRVQLDCVFYNGGRATVTVLPLLKSALSIDGAKPVAAMSEARFPLNDKTLFKGPVIAPGKGLSGYISFPLSAKVDATQRLMLVIAPALTESAEAPFSVTIGPIEVAKH